MLAQFLTLKCILDIDRSHVYPLPVCLFSYPDTRPYVLPVNVNSKCNEFLLRIASNVIQELYAT